MSAAFEAAPAADPSTARERLLPLAGALLLLLVPYRALLGRGVPVARDLLFYFLPLKMHLVEALRAGEVPWIDRYRWGGLPLLGAPGVAAFDPGNLLFLALPLGTAAKAWILLRLAIAATGFAAFSRRLGLGSAAAAVAGLAFGLAGVTGSLAPFLGASSAHAFLPWLAAFGLDLSASPRPRSVVRFAAVGGLLALTAVPELLFHGAVVALVVLAPRPRSGISLLRVAGAALVSLLLALGLGAAALVPAGVSALDSVRGPGGGTNLAFASAAALPVGRLPQLLGDGLGPDWTAEAPKDESPYPYLPSITPGRAALLLAAVGLVLGGAGRLRAATLIVLGLLLAVGPATPFFAAAARLFPPLLTLRYPEKHAILASFGFLWLAALGLGALELRLGPRALRLVLPLLALAVLVDRERTARRLMETAPPSVLEAAPRLLAAVPPAGPFAPPPRLFHRDSYAPVPAFDLGDLAAAGRTARATLLPEYATLFGRGYLFELDYDLSLPLDAFEWTRLLNRAIPAGGPLPRRLLRAAGVAAEIASERPRGASGFAPRVGVFKEPLSPYRFARRAVFDPDGRRLFGRMLEEAFAPDTAYLKASGAPATLATGRVLSVLDTPSALRLEVEAPPGAGAILMVYRLRSACEEATLDGVPVAPLDLSFGFTAVRIPPGRHLLRLRPATVWVKIGGTVAVCSLLALVALAASARRTGRAAEPGSAA